METKNELPRYALIALIKRDINYLQTLDSVSKFYLNRIKNSCKHILNYISKLEEKDKE